jgi:ATP-binding cassette subfamily F protein uup
VSHDRFFLDQVATHTLAWNSSGAPRWELYEGPPSTVRSLRAERDLQNAPGAGAPKADSRIGTKPESSRPRKPGLSQKEQRRLTEVEQILEAHHERLMELDAILADPSAFLSAEGPGHRALLEREAIKGRMEPLELEWLAMEEKRTGG